MVANVFLAICADPHTHSMVTDLSFTCHEQLWIVLFHFSEIRQIFRDRGGDAEKIKHFCLLNHGMLNKNKWQPLLLNLRVTCCLFSGFSAKGSLLLVAWGKDLFSSMTGQTRIRASSKFVIDNFITFKVIWVSYFSYSPDVTITSERMFKTKTNSVQFISSRKTLKTPFHWVAQE